MGKDEVARIAPVDEKGTRRGSHDRGKLAGRACSCDSILAPLKSPDAIKAKYQSKLLGILGAILT